MSTTMVCVLACRRLLAPGAGPPSVTAAMNESQAEEILLDEDAEAAGHSFWDLGDLQVGLPGTRAASV